MKNKNQIKRLYAGLPIVKEARTWAEIDVDALCYNYRTVMAHLASLSPSRPVPIICVVKADAYGHGAGAVARALLDEGCRFFAVSCIEEAVELRGVCREVGVNADILILGYTRPSLAPVLAKADLITALPSAKYARELAAAARASGVRVRAHVKLDTGMNRIGFPAHTEAEISEALRDIALLSRESGLSLEGLFTHFARADEDSDLAPTGLTDVQQKRFFAVKNGLDAFGVPPLMCHICNSAGAIRLPDCLADAVRVGISLYGCPPSEVLDVLPLRPVMRLVTMISHIHTLQPGETVSYGGTFTASEPRRIATLPVGYADGFIRAYSGASVRIATRTGEVKAPIVGRICMDQCMVDITNTDAAVGDAVTLFGTEPCDIADLARRADTIPYEVLCLVSARVPRRYV